MMGIPDDIKENVRAVLLSKTDGSGILVSTFLRDYKAMIHKPLMYKDLGYDSLEKFIKDLPDVCRLEYSDQYMAFKLFGIAKPNTYVSSFVKRAEGGCEDLPSSRKSGRKLDTVRPTNDLNERWEPNTRGLYTLCFPNKRIPGLETKEAVAMKFAQLGEVVEISSITSLTFIRYRDEKAAKKAVQLYGEEFKVRRADERMSKSSDNKRDKKQSAYSPRSVTEQSLRKGDKEHFRSSQGSNKESSGKRVNGRPLASDDENWDDEPGSYCQKPSTGGYGGYSSTDYQQNHISDHDTEKTWHGATKLSRSWEDSQRINNDLQRGLRNDSGDSHYPRQEGGSHIPDHQTSTVQVYVGNWPNEADEADLKALMRPYNCLGCRILQARDSKVKKYAFVDFKDEKDAFKVIKDLNNAEYKNRGLQCRLGKKKQSGNDSLIRDSDKCNKGSIEQEFERLNVHKGSPRQDEGTSHLESLRQQDKSPRTKSPKMPILETPKMPCLETSSHVPSKMVLQGNIDIFPHEMPPLEKVMSPTIPDTVNQKRLTGMPNLEEISHTNHVNGVADQNVYNPVQLNVGNFSYGTSENELMMLLGRYGAQRITIMNRDITSRSTYAFADFTNVSQAVNAMENLDQSLFKGRKLVVTLTNPGAVYHQQNVAQIPSLTCTVTGDADRTVYVQDMTQRSPVSIDVETVYEQSLRPNRSHFNYQRLTTTLQEYTRICTKLRDEDLVQMAEGMTLSVTITHIENEKFFWAQILEDSMNGVNRGLQHLVGLAREMQSEPKTEQITGLGRCMAKYENEWFRAWCTFLTERNGQEMGDVIFIDYGNRAFTPKTEMLKSKPTWWSLPPMAKPFKLIDAKYDLDKYLNQAVTLEVVEPGNHRTNSLTTVRLYW